eukprot:Awhi_evm1s5570
MTIVKRRYFLSRSSLPFIFLFLFISNIVKSDAIRVGESFSCTSIDSNAPISAYVSHVGIQEVCNELIQSSTFRTEGTTTFTKLVEITVRTDDYIEENAKIACNNDIIVDPNNFFYTLKLSPSILKKKGNCDQTANFTIDDSYNPFGSKITAVDPHVFTPRMKQLEHIKIIDHELLNLDFLKYFEENTFPKLTALSFQRNNISFTGSDMSFRNFTALETLDLQSNEVDKLT